VSILQCDLDREEKEWEGVRGVARQGAELSLKGGSRANGSTGGVRGSGGEDTRVRFKTADNADRAERHGGDSGLLAGDASGEGAEEILRDTNGPDTDQNGVTIAISIDRKRDEVTSSEPPSLGTTPSELPILIRLASDDASQLPPSVHQRPGMRRHLSASAVQTSEKSTGHE
jgi:hypothetical protein